MRRGPLIHGSSRQRIAINRTYETNTAGVIGPGRDVGQCPPLGLADKDPAQEAGIIGIKDL
jgi:hypothetical protein